jgi:hypothetical protein
MNRFRLKRTHIALVIGVPLLVATVALPGTALAKTKAPPAVSGLCTHLAGNAGSTSGPEVPTLTGCSPVPNAGAPGTFTFPFAASGTSVIHWANGATTSFTFKSKTTLPTKTKKGATVPNPKFHCPAGNTIEAALKGKIPKTGNGSLPSGDTGLKGSVKATVCVTAAFQLSLLPGTTFTL